MVKGIDISEHQGKIDIAALKGQVDFIILRIGYTGYGKSKSKQLDKYFERNYKLCKDLGIPVGGYWYSCATSVSEAEEEAKIVLSAIQGKQFEYPIYFDTEDNHNILKYSPKSQYSIGKKALTDVAIAFLEMIESKGWYVGIYASTNWLNNQLEMNRLKAYDVWVAHYDVSKPTYKGTYGMWQFTSKAKLEGYSGNLDMNLAYKDYPNIIQNAELNGYGRKDIEDVIREIDTLLAKYRYTWEEVMKWQN